MTYDFLGSAYINTSSADLNTALMSINKQTLKPNKVVLVFDGQVNPELFEVVRICENYLRIDLLVLRRNLGLGAALREGLNLCESKFVLRFDTDDYNFPMRAEKQILFMKRGNYDISSSFVSEFINNIDNVVSVRKVPLNAEKIRQILPFRNPFNHPAICLKLDSIIKLEGGYRNFPFYEDYDLWIRAIHNGLNCANLGEPLVAMKSNDMIQRRIGMRIVFYEIKLFKTFWKYSFKDFMLFLFSFVLRTFIRILPLKFVSFFYRTYLRSKINN